MLMESHIPSSRLKGQKTLFLNPESMPVRGDGLENFYWPISRKELETFRDQAQGELMKLLRQKDLAKDIDWQVVRILSYEIITDALMVYQSVALHRRASEIGLMIEAPETFRLHHALNSSQMPPPPRFSDWLWRGMRPPRTLFRWLRPLRDLKPLGHFRRKRLWLMNRSNDLVAIAAHPFMQRHAEIIYSEEAKRVTLCSFWEWFSLEPAEEQAMKCYHPVPDQVLQQVLEVLASAFKSHGEELSSLMRNYFAQWIRKASIPIRFYYERLLMQPERLPLTLWYGSTNHLWTRVLRAAVQVTGGRCIGHDHGRGVSTCPNRGEHGVVLDLCDEYVAYSPFLAKEFAALDQEIQAALPCDQVPKFFGREDLYLPPPAPVAKPNRVESRAEPKVMYLASQWFGESLFLNCLPADPVTVDWQARLLSKLSSWRVRPFYKVHPESSFQVPDNLTLDLGVEKVTGYIEDCYYYADIFIFDFLSSPFRSIAFSDKGMVFVDFGLGQLSQTLMEVLSRRCVIVKGWYDSDNRAQVDWNELKAALEHAPQLTDRSCVRTLFGEGIQDE